MHAKHSTIELYPSPKLADLRTGLLHLPQITGEHKTGRSWPDHAFSLGADNEEEQEEAGRSAESMESGTSRLGFPA